ncbi:MAG: molecular chaperone TorD family protein [Gammaproteobacteria bacterium]|nr:molecular chaperone TorD family protein [Gammaproteobacteria bacterium]
MAVSHLHGFLATVFRQEVSAEFLRQLRSDEMRATLEAGDADLGERVFDGPENEVLEELAVEYAALFLGPGGHISPHESIYAEAGTGSLWGKETVAVKRYVEGLGFQYDKQYAGIPDHISVELELMSELARRESVAWENGDKDQAANCLEYQQEFVRDHLSTWVYTFCDKVVTTTQLPFYRETARLLADFLGGEEEEIDRRLAAAKA